ncbi:MAG: hypothetical protein FJ144_04585 [Deltaproteobacteria bacterium]|nr:hypothetical protein [Deltaproteobacteria bacterium]
MRSRPTRVRATWLALSLLLSVSVATSLGLSLCIAKDGHASLELSHADAPCTLEVERHHPEEAAFDARELSHHPCEDRPLTQRTSWMASPYVRMDAPPLVAVALAATAPPAIRVTVGDIADAATALESLERQRRGIVLVL